MDFVTLPLAGFFGHWLWPILQLAIGLGLVIFVHELGHFLVAKFVGIKVERFAIGFGPRLFGVKKGETDYCVNALPLGGYVKMLGQEDFAPMDEAQQQDPRSFAAKSVGARLAVISAGVVMNVILASLLFVLIGLVGKEFMAPVVGDVVAGYPAATAPIVWPEQNPPGWQQPGLQPGDRILEIDGDPIPRYDYIFVEGAFGGDDETFRFTIERTVDEWKYRGVAQMGVKPLPDGSRKGFGIKPAASTVFAEREGYETDEPFEVGDKVVAIAGRPVEHHWDIREIARALDGRPITVTVLRIPAEDAEPVRVDVRVHPVPYLKEGVVFLADGRALLASHVEAVEKDKKTVVRVISQDGGEKEFPEEQVAGGSHEDALDVAGMLPRLKVLAVERGSPADDAGLKPGDVILSYADRTTPTLSEFRRISDEKLDTQTRIVVLRDGLTVGPLEIEPATKREKAMVGILQGIDAAHAVVAAVREGSPAEDAGVLPGDEVTAVNGEPVEDWAGVLRALQRHIAVHPLVEELGTRPSEPAKLTVRRGVEELTLELPLPAGAFEPDHYALDVLPGARPFRPLTVFIQKKNPLAAIAWGANETWFHVRSTVATLGALIGGGLSAEMVRGPVGISEIAIQAGRKSAVDLVYLMALISAAVAVINFLPVPVLDGGHAAFLVVEKIRGKPIPLKVANIIQVIGLVLILGLFLAITWQDFARIIGGWW
jgi:regulator of sigma E protease